MQIKLKTNGLSTKMVDEDHIINVPDDSDFFTAFQAITKAMRDECIYEDEIQSITFDGDPS